MEEKLLDLTNPQKNIWYLEKFYNNSSLNTICGTAFVNEVTDFSLLKESICHIVNNNYSFHLKITLEKNEPKQYYKVMEYDVPIVDVNSKEEYSEYINNKISIPFDIYNKNLFNFYIFRFPNGFSAFTLIIHHLISDSWTLGLVCNEIIKNYSNLKRNLPLLSYENTYLDYINSEQSYMESNRFTKDKEYWENLFKTLPEPITIPKSINNTNITNSSKANRIVFTVDKSLINDIRNFCKNNKVSEFNFFMAVFGLYLSRVCKTEDFVVGTPILNRNNFNAKRTCGMFISTAPFRFEINNNISFAEFCSIIGKNSLSMLRHQQYPYSKILDYLRENDTEIPNLYNVLISYQITNTQSNEEGINYNTTWSFNGNCSDPLNIQLFDLNDTGNLNIAYDYQTDMYQSSDINFMHNRIIYIINQVLNNSALLLKDIEILTPEEKEKILIDFNKTDLEYDINSNVISLFEKQVKNTPDKIALVSNGKSLTYKELNSSANIFANFLKNKHNVKPNDTIGIILNRSSNLIIAILAILKCGANYMPIDPEYPQERITYMLENSKTKVVVTNNLTEEYIPVKHDHINIDLFNSTYKLDIKDTENLNVNISPKSLVYLIYTSGSTGNPKGVMITHRNLHNFILGMKQAIDFNPNKVCVSLTTICFDIFGLELWCSLCYGLTLVLADEEEQNDVVSLNKLCLENNVNIIQTTPSRYSALLSKETNLEFLNNITDILVGGESLPKNLLAKFKELSNATIINVYGPTETTIWSTLKDLTNTNLISVGKPIANTQCYILDKNLKPLPYYCPGELYIGGDGVTNGYLGREDLTEEKFIPSPFKENEKIYNTNDLAYYTPDGDIVHLGRTDFQVKIRGYRIEVEEIENKIIRFPGIKHTVVIPNKNNKYLYCYYVTDKQINPSKLISFLLKYLPNYMIPAYFKRIDKIPLTPNGKINRKALPPIDENTNTNIELAQTNTEKLISSILEKILKTDNLDINTPFLSLGIDSLGIIELQTSLLHYNLNLTTQTFYRYPTIKRLAKRIDTHEEYYTEMNFQIPESFKHTETEIDNIKVCTDQKTLGNVLLTGANGFIGVHVLHELLETTNIKIYCFVRGTSKVHALSRLKESYEFYFNKDISEYFNDRIYVFNGEIIYDNFNLSQEDLDMITSNTKTIIHTAAIVKHYGDFEQFKDSNIDGTRRIASFAYANKKRLIHISSISVSGNYLVKQDNHNVAFTENDLYIGQHYTKNVYVNSKFDAEKVVYSFMEKGLTAEVLRIGILSGRYSDGVFQKNITANAFYSRIKSLIELKHLSYTNLEQHIEFTPVDLCAKAIVLLAETQTAENKVFHLYNDNLVNIKDIINVLKDFNYNITPMDDETFKEYILKVADSSENSNQLKGIINDISFDNSDEVLNYNFSVDISSEFTNKYLNLLDFKWPELDKDYLTKIFKYMKKVKFI